MLHRLVDALTGKDDAKASDDHSAPPGAVAD
jgi:hypothetical protein